MSVTRVMVVEDESIIALSLGKSLERLGYEVVDTVTTGEEAARKARELAPDLVLMDIVLAGRMDGIAAAREIRKGSDIPIIYLTANADAATVESARDTMPYGYLNKPINERDLLTNVDSAIHQHRMERRLRESEEKYRGLIENLNDIILSTDEKGIVTFISPQVREIAGYDESEVTGRSIIDFIYPEDRTLVGRMFDAGNAGFAQKGEFRVVSKSGALIWLRTSGRPSFVQGRFTGVRGILSDITKQREAEEAVARVNSEIAMANEELESTNEEFETQNRELIAARDELMEQEAMLRSILRVAPVGIGIVRDRVLGWTNTMLNDMTGYPEEELAGKNARILYPSDEDYEYVGIEKYRQIQERGTGTVETRWRRKDGSIIDIMLSSTPIDQSNLGAGVIFTAMDITERKHAERALAESEEKYRHLMDNMSDSLWVLDLKTMKFIYNSPSSVNILGYTEEESREHSVADVVTPEYLDLVAKAMKEELERDGSPGVDPDRTRMIELEQIHKDGSLVWCEMTMRFLRDESGRPDRILGVSRNITGRKRTEQALAESEEKFRLLVEHSPFPITVLDNATGRFTYSNRALAGVFGYTAVDVPNLHDWWEAAYPDPAYRKKRREAWDKALEEIGRTGIASSPQEADMRCKDGSVKRIEYRLMNLGKKSALIMNDVTEKKRTQEMMIQTEKMSSLGGLAAGMAHEINNPLGIVLQGVQAVLSRLSTDSPRNREVAERTGSGLEAMRAYLEEREVFDYLAGIQDAGHRAAKIVSNMLQFSRRSETAIAPVDINALIEKTIEIASNDYDLKKSYDFKTIHIIRDFDADLPKVSCSETGIGQVVFNLMKNAAQSLSTVKGPGFKPSMAMKTWREGKHVVLEISDNGSGIDPSVMPRVFEPFFTTKTAGTGTGLGLSVSYYIVTTIHRGTISVSNGPDGGAAFIIKLPFGGA
ncbi:MAG: PAS domain S-box protein [Chrysiogenales bacterium]|nr:MAG: PAS domain S-box protein [Chrysiogenales bacterium]